MTLLYPYRQPLARVRISAATLAVWLRDNPPLFPGMYNVLNQPILDPAKSKSYSDQPLARSARSR